MRHVGEEFVLVLGAERELLRLVLQRLPRRLHLAVLLFDFRVLFGEQRRLLFELFVDLLQLLLLFLEQLLGLPQRPCLLLELRVRFLELVLLPAQLLGLALQLLRELLRLLQQLLRPHVRLDHVQHDADGVGQLVQERLVDAAEREEARQLDHRLHLTLEQDRQHDDVARRGLAEARRDLDIVVGHVREQDGLLFERRLPHQSLADHETVRDVLPRPIRVARDETEVRRPAFGVHDEEGAVVRGDQRGQLAHDQPRHGLEVLLSLHHAAELREVRLEPVLLLVALRRLAQVGDHLVDVRFQLVQLALRFDGDLAREVALRHRRGHVRDVPHLHGQRVGHRVHAVGEPLPGARHARYVRLAAELSFRTHLARHAGHFVREDAKLLHHVVDGVLELEHFALHLDGDLLGQIAVGDRRHHEGDVAHLRGEIRRQTVHVVREVAPYARGARHLRLSAELSFRAHLARHAGHFRRERVELIDHRIERVLQLEDLAAHFDGDLARQIAARDRGAHVGDVAHLRREVRRHVVHVVGQILPRAGDARHVRLTAQAALGAHLARHARHFVREDAELLDHVVDRFLELQDFAADVDRDFL